MTKNNSEEQLLGVTMRRAVEQILGGRVTMEGAGVRLKRVFSATVKGLMTCGSIHILIKSKLR